MNTRRITVSCVLVFSICWLFAGCACTQMTSIRDPKYSSKSYNNILIFVNLTGLDFREFGEYEIANDLLAACSTNCVLAHQLFFPGKEYSDSEASKIMDDCKIEAILVVNLSGSGTSQSYVPPYTVSHTSGNAWIYGNSISGSSTTRTNTYGGYNINKPWASFSAQVYDRSENSAVWIATAGSRGNTFADNYTLLKSLSKEIAYKLMEDHLLR